MGGDLVVSLSPKLEEAARKFEFLFFIQTLTVAQRPTLEFQTLILLTLITLIEFCDV